MVGAVLENAQDRVPVSLVQGDDAGAAVERALQVVGGVTVAAGFAAYADGAEHPGTTASVLVAARILLGGPRVMAAIRSRARRATVR